MAYMLRGTAVGLARRVQDGHLDFEDAAHRLFQLHEAAFSLAQARKFLVRTGLVDMPEPPDPA